MYSKKTKIVATIGPVSESAEMLEKLVKAGLNVMRLNFSHGDYNEHGGRITNGRAVAKKLGLPLAILQDLPGPKIRIGEFYKERVMLKAGDKFVLTTEKRVGDENGAYINYAKLPKEVSKGSIIFLDDGKKKLIVESVKGEEIVCKIIVGGETKGKRGVNVPGAYLSISSLTPTDKKHVDFGIERGVDYMALSFVRRAKDVKDLRTILDKKKANIKIIAKIETSEAIENIDEIIEAADGIMVARGDLAVEVPKEEVPVMQKMIIKKCNKVGKPVITATQMLESMIQNSVPTRAEVNDVANAIFDGTDAVMLSEETTLGAYPVDAVKTMAEIAAHTEKHLEYEEILKGEHLELKSVTDAVSFAALNLAHEVEASAIVALSASGFTARKTSRYKPARPVFVITPEEKSYNRLALSFGCYPILISHNFESFTSMMKEAKELLLKSKLVKKGDKFVLIGGIPFGVAGATNTVSIQEV
ncbi:MAG: pyruvate kinase [Patescibacteria group bacterium]|nr:pyruvate kinase [Patescibacteria group bacterium]